jgi:hypothetical protein
MDELEALKKIQQMSVAEKMARLTKADFAYVQNCIEQAMQEEQNERQECDKEETKIDVKKA